MLQILISRAITCHGVFDVLEGICMFCDVLVAKFAKYIEMCNYQFEEFLNLKHGTFLISKPSRPTLPGCY